MNTDGQKNRTDGRSTAEAKARAREIIKEFNRRRHLAPICGATCRTTGEPCQNLAMSNGRCRLHGGATPKAAGWHRLRWPNGSAPDAVARADRKAVDFQKRARKRKQRVAQMSPEEQAAHKAWQATHKPGSSAERARRRAERKAAADARRLVTGADKPKPVSAETQALLDAIAAGEARLTKLQHETEMAENWNRGVFA